MPIPQSQLDTWSRKGGTAASTDAYASIRFALEKQTSPLNGRPVEIFLQGSYANSTNIHADSDIDVVVLYHSTFYKDMSALTERSSNSTNNSFHQRPITGRSCETKYLQLCGHTMGITQLDSERNLLRLKLVVDGELLMWCQRWSFVVTLRSRTKTI